MRVVSLDFPVAIVAGGLLLLGCASGGGGDGTARVDQNLITFEELRADPSLDLLTLIERERPRWMRPRGTVTFGGQVSPAVFVDDVRQPGGVDVLRSLRVTDIHEVRFMNARDATTRYGTDMISGAILVTRR